MGSKGRAVLLVAVLVTNRREMLFFSIRIEFKVAEYRYLGRDTVAANSGCLVAKEFLVLFSRSWSPCCGCDDVSPSKPTF